MKDTKAKFISSHPLLRVFTVFHVCANLILKHRKSNQAGWRPLFLVKHI